MHLAVLIMICIKSFSFRYLLYSDGPVKSYTAFARRDPKLGCEGWEGVANDGETILPDRGCRYIRKGQ